MGAGFALNIGDADLNAGWNGEEAAEGGVEAPAAPNGI